MNFTAQVYSTQQPDTANLSKVPSQINIDEFTVYIRFEPSGGSPGWNLWAVHVGIVADETSKGFNPLSDEPRSDKIVLGDRAVDGTGGTTKISVFKALLVSVVVADITSRPLHHQT